MKENMHFQKQQPKLKNEAILKSVLSGLAVGFGANFITAVATWFAPINGLWICLGVLAAVTAAATPIFYAKCFRPTNTTNARRIDRLGLEERLITMVELENDDSCIAQLQREDAQAALANVDNKQLKIRIPKKIIAAVVICAVLGVAMTTLNILGELGVLPDGNELLESFVEEQKTVYVSVTYIAGEGGMIEGDEAQILVQGTDAAPVTAVADDGYVFKRWSDGSTNPTRTDLAVGEDVVYTAEFVELDDENGDGDGDGEGDKPDDAPGNGDSQSQDQQQDPNNNDAAQGAGGAYEPNNQVINGETYYRDVLEEYQEAAEDLLTDPNSGLSDEERELIKKYLGIV